MKTPSLFHLFCPWRDVPLKAMYSGIQIVNYPSQGRKALRRMFSKTALTSLSLICPLTMTMHRNSGCVYIFKGHYKYTHGLDHGLPVMRDSILLGVWYFGLAYKDNNLVSRTSRLALGIKDTFWWCEIGQSGQETLAPPAGQAKLMLGSTNLKVRVVANILILDYGCYVSWEIIQFLLYLCIYVFFFYFPLHCHLFSI